MFWPSWADASSQWPRFCTGWVNWIESETSPFLPTIRPYTVFCRYRKGRALKKLNAIFIQRPLLTFNLTQLAGLQINEAFRLVSVRLSKHLQLLRWRIAFANQPTVSSYITVAICGWMHVFWGMWWPLTVVARKFLWNRLLGSRLKSRWVSCKSPHEDERLHNCCLH